MKDETDHDGMFSEIAIFAIVPVRDVGCWSVRITVAHRDGPVHGWVPFVFWSRSAAANWLRSRTDRTVRPAVRDCPHGPNDFAYAAVVEASGDELVLSEPLPRASAAAAAALLAAEFRANADR